MKNILFAIISTAVILSGSVNSAEFKPAYPKSVIEKSIPKDSSLGDVDIEFGIKGYMRMASTIRVKVTIKNIKRDFAGSVQLRYYSVGNTLSSYSEKINLHKGGNADLYFYPFLNTESPDFTVAFADSNGKVVESFDDEIESDSIDGNSDLVIAGLLPKDSKFSFAGEKNFRIKKIYLTEEQIEGDYRTLLPFDLIIIPDNAETVLKAKTLDILKDREKYGRLSIYKSDVGKFNLARLYLGRDNRTEWIGRVEQVLIPVLGNLNIKTIRYIIIIFIYIIVVSPVTYFILAKRRRKVEYWIFVPIWSLIFTAIIYMAGSNSRIDGMYMNYVSLLDLRDDRHIENVDFSVTNSSNIPYKLEINNGYRVDSLYGSYSKADGKDSKKVIYNIESKTGGTDINVMEESAFDTLFLRAEGKPAVSVNNAGEIYRDNGVLKGRFNNTTGADLNRVFAVYDDEIIYIGDVAKGESKNFAAEEGNLFLNDLNAKLQDSVFLGKIFDFAYEGEKSKLRDLLAAVLEKNSDLDYKKPFFAALPDEKLPGEFASEVENVNGYTILLLSAEKKEDIGIGENNFVNAIGVLPMSEGEYGYLFSNTALLNRNSIDISYTLDKGKKVKSLSLLSRYKEDINPCRVYVLNHLTGTFDFIFSPDHDFVEKIKNYTNSGGKKEFDRGEDQSFNIASAYVENGKITLRYEVEQSEYDEISAFYIPGIPNISLEYEE